MSAKIYKVLKNKASMAKFHVIIEKDEDSGFIGHVPELPECISQDDTLDELMSNMKEAIELCLETSEQESSTRFVGVQEISV